MKIDFANLKYQYLLYKKEIDSAIQSVLDKTNFIMGEEVEILEKKLEEFTNCKFCLTCSNGTDALILSMMSLGIGRGDEVITTPFSYVSSSEIISIMGAKPVYADIDPCSFNIDEKNIQNLINENTKAILPVSLYGQPPNYDKIKEIADNFDLKVILDGAQSFGAKYKNSFDSNLGDVSTTSFFPAKPFGCYGDGGAIFTNNNKLAKKIKMLRVHGQTERYVHKHIGLGARLDTLQAAILIEKLKYYSDEIRLRQQVAETYNKELSNLKQISLPVISSEKSSVWAQYTIKVKNRDKLQKHLKEKGVPTAIHYPMPLHLQECFNYLGYKKNSLPLAEKVSKEVLSLPMNPFLGKKEIKYICNEINNFFLKIN
tara:strand:- start:288 stop:1400 length:1113 start_codon:yes stop_codon:yes gene_type:complete